MIFPRPQPSQTPKFGLCKEEHQLKKLPLTFIGPWCDGFNTILESHLFSRSVKLNFIENDIADYIILELLKDSKLKIEMSGTLRTYISNVGTNVTKDAKDFRRAIETCLRMKNLDSNVCFVKWKNDRNQVTLIRSECGDVLLSVEKKKKVKPIDIDWLTDEEKHFDELKELINSYMI
jgi:hypothetical protein